MKRILKQTLGFVLVNAAIATALYLVSEKLAPVYYRDKVRIQKMREYASSIEAINVGGSHNRAIDYKGLKLRGFHLWKAGSDIFETQYMLDAVLPMLPRLKVVFVNVSPLAFGHDNSLEERRQGLRRQYYARTPTIRSWQPINGDLKNLFKGKISPILREDHWRAVFDSIASRLFGNEDEAQMKFRKRFGRVDKYGNIGPRMRGRMEPKTPTARSELLLDLIDSFERNAQQHPQLSSQAFETFVSIIKTLRKRKLRVIFWTAPVTDIANKLFLTACPEGVLQTKQNMQRLIDEFGIAYYDFSQDPLFTQKYEYFFNEDHMNKFGAKEFSRKLRKVCGLSNLEKM